METLLLGIAPPSNVERILNEAKQQLFSSFASVSAIALGPVIPLRYLRAPIERPAARTLPHGLELATREWTHLDEVLVLSVEPVDGLRRLAHALGGEPQGDPDTDAPLPRVPGLYVTCTCETTRRSRWSTAEAKQTADAREMILRLGPPPRLRWTVSELVCWRIQLRFPERWWDDLRCEELWRVRLRKGSAKARP